METQSNTFGPIDVSGGYNIAGNNIRGHNIHVGGPPQDENVLCALQSVDPRDEKKRIIDTKDELLPDPYTWIFDDQTFRDWLYRSDTRLLWIKGGPGKGKTMMTAGIIDMLLEKVKKGPKESLTKKSWMSRFKPRSKKRPRKSLLCYFFCQNTDSQLNRAISILKGLIFMLAAQDETLMQLLQETHKRLGKDCFHGRSALFSLRRILDDMLDRVCDATVYMVVDALDECSDPELPDLLKSISKDGIKHPSVKWLVTSRPSPNLENSIRPDQARSKISLEIESNSVSQGIQSFVNRKVESLAELRGWSPEIKQEARSYLIKNAEGTFLWVALVCKRLQDLDQWEVLEEILQISRLRQGLDPFYGRMIQLIHEDKKDKNKADLCIQILRTATLTYRPLRLDELGSVAGMPQNLLEHDSQDHKGLANLVEKCGSFLTIRGRTVYFIHQSAKDYLETGEGLQIFTSNQTQEHGLIAQRCLQTLTSNLKHRNFPCLISLRAQLIPADERLLAKINYACCYWISHIIKASRDTTDGNGAVCEEQACELFKNYFIPWIEAVSRLKDIPALIRAVEELKKSRMRRCRNLDALIVDSYRFLRHSRHILEEDPLQAYLSAPLFAPKDSLIRKRNEGRIPKLTKVIGGLQQDWDACLQTLLGHSSSIRAVAFSPDGSLVASASDDRTVRLWDTATGSQRAVLEGHSSTVEAVVFSPDGSLVASASDDRTVKLWDVKRGTLLQSIFTLSIVYVLDFRADGRSIYTNCGVFEIDGKFKVGNSSPIRKRLFTLQDS